MCLYTKQILPIRARRDITVYKELIKCSKGYITPYIGVPVALHSIVNAAQKDVFLPKRAHKIFLKYKIEEEFIHCYTDRESAISQLFVSSSVIVKCTIKKGTLYYRSCIHHEICAKSIEVHDIVAWTDNEGFTQFKE